MAKTSYYEKLRDPRWQKRRLEIMQRDDFRCRFCKNSKDTLNVHHRWYDKGKNPWEYEDRVLQTLCERCHKEMEGLLRDIRRHASFSKTNAVFIWLMTLARNGDGLTLPQPLFNLMIPLTTLLVECSDLFHKNNPDNQSLLRLKDQKCAEMILCLSTLREHFQSQMKDDEK